MLTTKTTVCGFEHVPLWAVATTAVNEEKQRLLWLWQNHTLLLWTSHQFSQNMILLKNVESSDLCGKKKSITFKCRLVSDAANLSGAAQKCCHLEETSRDVWRRLKLKKKSLSYQGHNTDQQSTMTFGLQGSDVLEDAVATAAVSTEVNDTSSTGVPAGGGGQCRTR